MATASPPAFRQKNSASSAALPSLQNAGAYESESALCEAVEAGDIDRGICFTGRSGFRMIANDPAPFRHHRPHCGL